METKYKKRIKQVVMLVLLLVIPTVIFYAFVFTGVHHVTRLPFFGPPQLEEKMYRGQLIMDTTPHSIPEFAFYTPDSNWLKSTDLDSHIYVANFIDYRILKKFPDQLVYMYSELAKEHKSVKFVTHIENYDGSPLEKPEDFTQVWRDQPGRWTYVLGDSASFANVKNQGYFIADAATGKNPDPYSVVLIDKERHIRGYYNPTLAADSKRIKEEVSHLIREYGYNFKTHKYYQFDDKIEQKRK